MGRMKRTPSLLAALALCAALAAGCRTAGPWERHFSPTAAAPGSIPDEPQIAPESVLAGEFDAVAGAGPALAALAAARTGGDTNAPAPAFVELGRSAFVAQRASRDSAVEFAARLGADAVLFSTEDLGTHWVRVRVDPDPFWDPPPPPPPPRHHRGGPPPRWRHRHPPPDLWWEREELVPVKLYRFLALFLRTQPAP